jgi:hypothetical protein
VATAPSSWRPWIRCDQDPGRCVLCAVPGRRLMLLPVCNFLFRLSIVVYSSLWFVWEELLWECRKWKKWRSRLFLWMIPYVIST